MLRLLSYEWIIVQGGWFREWFSAFIWIILPPGLDWIKQKVFIYVPAAYRVRCAEIQKTSMVHCAGNNDFAEKDSAKIHH